MIMSDKFMQRALDALEKTAEDIPVCAVIVKNDEIISLALNKREKLNRTTAHAEILAIEEANKKLNSWRLNDCDMYVTLEPCPMCTWAILNSRIKNLYFGSYDAKYGACSSAVNLKKLADSKINIKGGVMEKECDELLKNYFKEMRK